MAGYCVLKSFHLASIPQVEMRDTKDESGGEIRVVGGMMLVWKNPAGVPLCISPASLIATLLGEAGVSCPDFSHNPA